MIGVVQLFLVGTDVHRAIIVESYRYGQLADGLAGTDIEHIRNSPGNLRISYLSSNSGVWKELLNVSETSLKFLQHLSGSVTIVDDDPQWLVEYPLKVLPSRLRSV